LRNKKILPPEPYISFRKDAFVYNYIASLASLIQAGVNISGEMKLLKFEELMLYLLEKHPQPILSFMAAQNTGARDFAIRKTVEANLTSNISLEEMAFLCNTSLSTFKRLFTKIYGTSPNKWILLRRMELAKDLLIHFKEKPGDIYHKIGYENHSSFSKSFRQVYGITPKDFQKQNLNVYQ
jgi:AraC-like DNA-binding protein